MKYIEFAVMKDDMNAVLEYLGRKAAVQFPEIQDTAQNQDVSNIMEIINRLKETGEYIGIDSFIAQEGKDINDDDFIRNKDKQAYTEAFCSAIEYIKYREKKLIHEKQRVRETINEVRAFSRMNIPFSDFEHLSYLTLRIGRMDPKNIAQLSESVEDRCVIIKLDSADKILAASSKKGRFALDSQLKKYSFEPIAVSENYRAIPGQMQKSLDEQYANIENELENIKNKKEQLKKNHADELVNLVLSWHTVLAIEKMKAKFVSTKNLYHFTGWAPDDTVNTLVKGLSDLTKGRIAIRAFSPEEVPSIKSGKEKVPVAMKHNVFVKGFESLVFSYGAPLYGTIDPTAIVAFFFTLMFGIMFGDAGQGFVLLLLGIIIKKSRKHLVKFRKFSIPLISVGIASVIMGLLAGSVFANEKLLIAPTRMITSAITGQPMDRILHILPMAGEGGSIIKLFYFFGFTVAIGVIINSLGLIINIYNCFVLKKYENAVFSKTGLAGLLFFWYALFVIVRILFGGSFEIFDLAGIIFPSLCIFFGPVIWRVFAGKRKLLKNGLLAFITEGFVAVLETVSTYFSNTVSFLRVGAFALAHAVFSFIVFYFTDELARSGIAGTFSAILIMITGNAVIIMLEGLIVAIQVVRLQYYEFFNKFLIETGVEFSPFRFTYGDQT